MAHSSIRGMCVRDKKSFHFLKPVTVAIPHFLNLKDHDDIISLGLSFLKGGHEMNLQQMYDFQQAERDIIFKPFQKYSVLQTLLFCSLCLSSRNIMESLQKASFCMTTKIPCTFSFVKPSFAILHLLYVHVLENSTNKYTNNIVKHIVWTSRNLNLTRMDIRNWKLLFLKHTRLARGSLILSIAMRYVI